MIHSFQISAAKNYFLGFATSGAVLFASFFYFNKENETQNVPSFSQSDYVAAEKIPLVEFNPNELNEEGWAKIGFSERQIATILKYKKIVGGNFTSKAQLKKCYAISAEKFSDLEPYILLPENGSPTSKNYISKNYNSSNYSGTTYRKYNSFNHKSLTIPGRFNPDNFSSSDFVKMGFTENQSNSILKYKNYLGGSFISKEKFKACFIISDENYRKMEPFLMLPEKSAENSVSTSSKDFRTEKPKINYQNFDPNETDFEGWKKLGFSEKQAQVIVNYRDRNLKGSFQNLEDIKNCFVISPEKYAEIKQYIVFNPQNIKSNTHFKVENISFSSKQESKQQTTTDFTKVDLNEITFKQLIEFGFDEKSAAMLLSYRKKLGGFVNKQQIVDTYNIDKNLAQKLVAIAPLDDSKVAKYTLGDAPEEWLKTHPYFKYSADKIIELRKTNSSDQKILKLLNPSKPEYETRMKWYLKKQ